MRSHEKIAEDLMKSFKSEGKSTKPDFSASLPTKFREGRFQVDENVAEKNKLRLSHVISEFRAKDKESQRSVFQPQPCISKKHIMKELKMLKGSGNLSCSKSTIE